MPNTPLPDDEENETLTEEEIELILGQFPELENMTPMDALVMAGTLLDLEIPVPTDIIAKAHSGGLYFAH